MEFSSQSDDEEQVSWKQKKVRALLSSDDEDSANEMPEKSEQMLSTGENENDVDKVFSDVAKDDQEIGDDTFSDEKVQCEDLPSNDMDSELLCKNEKKKMQNAKIDEKLTIRSERQRMEREMPVNLPIHKPKQRTIQEFLSIKKSHIKPESLRSTSASLIETWQEIHQGIEKTAEFFESESEDESDNDNESVISAKEENCISDELKNEPEKEVAFETTNGVTNVIDQTVAERGQNDKDKNSEFDSETKISDGVDDPIENIENCPSNEKTSKWLDDMILFEKREALRRKLDPEILKKVPTLSGGSNTCINLDDEEPCAPSGAKELMALILKGRQQPALVNTEKTVTTTTTERNAEGEITQVFVEKIKLSQEPDVVKDFKPGAKLPQLLAKLKDEIEAKWEKEHKPRFVEASNKQNLTSCENLDEDDDDEEGEEVEESGTSESEPEEDDVVIKDKPKRFCVFGDSEAEESDNEGGDEADASDEESEEEVENNTGEDVQNTEKDGYELECSLPAFQPGGGMLMGGSALTQPSQQLPPGIFSPASSPAVGRVRNERDAFPDAGTMGTPTRKTTLTSDMIDSPVTVKKDLFGCKENDFQGGKELLSSANEETDDPFLFVSGAFPDTQKISNPPISQSQHKRIQPSQDDEDSNEGNSAPVNLNEENQFLNDVGELAEESKHTEETLIIRDDDDIRTSAKKKRAVLTFSDDEEDVEQDKPESDAEAKINEESDLEEGEKEEEVDYDSEENEFRPGEFFDQEAELSESEWSGDEDEKGLDVLDAEAGDADILDEDQVASQLGRIHMRRLLDEDARNVRLLQEILFEDGDLHTDGKGRDRKFRWKNLSGFEIGEDGALNEADSDVEGDDSQLVKLRCEKNKFLMKMEEEAKFEITDQIKSDPILELGKKLVLQRRQQNITASSTIIKSARFRSSFLTKDESYLSRLARSAVGGNDAPLGPAHSRNFIFVPQEQQMVEVVSEAVKRKSNGGEENGKKIKLSVAQKPSLLDQLL